MSWWLCWEAGIAKASVGAVHLCQRALKVTATMQYLSKWCVLLSTDWAELSSSDMAV